MIKNNYVMPADLTRIKDILLARDFERMEGVPEDEYLECKGQPYDLSQPFNKRELAKDVCAFANLDGGLIIIGARTRKRLPGSGDEIENLRPLERSLLNPEQYHKVLEDWIYPQVTNISICFYEGPSFDKGIFVIEIPKQAENSKPFLLKRIFDERKAVEILFGYAQRKRDNNQPISIVDLQRTLRKGFHYEKTLEQQFMLESFPALKKENWQAKQLLIDRPDYWQYLLTEELLRTRFKEIRLMSLDLERGAVLRKHQKVRGQEFLDWFVLKWPEVKGSVAMISGCINSELGAAWKGSADRLADPTPILNVVERLHAACKALIDWETDVFAVHPPSGLEPLRAAMLGTTKDILDELETLPDHLAEAVQRGRDHTATTPIVHKVVLDFRFTRQELILDTMARLEGNPAWQE